MQQLIGRAEDLVQAELANWAIYGDNGAGKSTFAASIPTGMKALVISTDVENIKPYFGRSHVTVRKLYSWGDLEAVYLGLRRGLSPDGAPNLEVGKRFVVVFDTGTSMQRIAIKKIMGYDVMTLSETDFTKFIMSVPTTPKGWEAWSQIGELWNEWSGYFMRLPCHKLFLYQEGTRAPTVPGEQHLTGPALTPVSIRRVKEAPELLGRLYVESGGERNELLAAVDAADPAAARRINPDAVERRRLLIGKHDAYATKGPTHILGYVVDQPIWSKLAVSLDPTKAALPLDGEAVDDHASEQLERIRI